jgi:hypothetical protein
LPLHDGINKKQDTTRESCFGNGIGIGSGNGTGSGDGADKDNADGRRQTGPLPTPLSRWTERIRVVERALSPPLRPPGVVSHGDETQGLKLDT